MANEDQGQVAHGEHRRAGANAEAGDAPATDSTLVESVMANESSRWDWTTKIGIPMLAIVLSFVTSWSTTSYTVESALQDRTEQGKIVYANIGYRYFSAVIELFDREAWEFRKGEADVAFYVAVLEDMQRDIRWLRTNPAYGDIQGENAAFPFAQNAITREIADKVRFNANTEDDFGINEGLLFHMCNLYVGSYWSKRDNEENVDGAIAIKKDVVTFAERLCGEHVASLSPRATTN